MKYITMLLITIMVIINGCQISSDTTTEDGEVCQVCKLYDEIDGECMMVEVVPCDN